MRISTPQIFRQGTTALLDQQAGLSKTQLQLATGKRVLTPADDPAAAARILGLREELSRAEQYQRNADFARSRLEQSETVLASAGNVVQRVHALAIRAQNGVLDDSDRRAVAVELRERLDELVALANSRDAGGEYLFAGYRSKTRPFALDAAGGVTYQGDAGQRFLEIGPGRQLAVTDSGEDLFMDFSSGNGTFVVDADGANAGTGIIQAGTVTDPSSWVADTYTVTFTSATSYEVRDSANTLITSGTYGDGAAIRFRGIQTAITGAPASGDRFTVSASTPQSIFQTVDRLADALETATLDAAGRTQVAQDANTALAELDRVLDQLNTARGRIGARRNALEAQVQSNEDLQLRARETLSILEDLDYAEAVSRFQLEVTALQAAQQSFARIQRLSLFDFL